MTKEIFEATVQYDDLKGTAAADRADNQDPEKWLEQRGHKKPDEFVLGITLWAGESRGKNKDSVSVAFLLVPGNYDSVEKTIKSSKKPLQVKRVEVDMTLAEFFGLFKRFSIAISVGGMLDGRKYTCAD